MSNIITHTASADAVVTMVKNQIKRERSIYPTYVKQNNVTAENVVAHKNALLALAYPDVKPDGRAPVGTPEREAKKFADKVRLGLSQHVAALDADEEDNKPVNYLTTEGLKSLADMTPDALAVAIAAEVERRTK